MNISKFYKDFSLLNDIFYKDSAIEVIEFLKSELINVKTLDVGCGDGQLTLPLLEHGFDIYGFDISEEMLNHIKIKVKNKNNFLVKDALDFGRSDLGEFSQAYCMRTSFGNFEKHTDNIKYLKNIYSSLAVGSIFYLDYLNFNKIINNFSSKIEFEKNDYVLKRESEIRNNYMYQTWTLYKDNNKIFTIKLGTYIYLEKEFTSMLNKIGFIVEKTFGNYNKELFNVEKSERLIYKLIK
jgi:SAM-dependent methyltransferase